MMSAVGDAVHVLPVINALKRVNPRTRITWVLQPGPAALVRGHRSVDDIVIFDRSRGLSAFAAVRSELAQRRFDLVINLQGYFKAGGVTALTRSPIKLGFDRSRARDMNWLFTNRKIRPHQGQHVQDQYFEFLDALGVTPEPVVWDLGPWEGERQWQREFVSGINRPFASIVVATSKPEKDWSPERWAEVSDALTHDFGMQVVLVGGRSDRELVAESVVMPRAKTTPRRELGGGPQSLVPILDAPALVPPPNPAPPHIPAPLAGPLTPLMVYTTRTPPGPSRR